MVPLFRPDESFSCPTRRKELWVTLMFEDECIWKKRRLFYRDTILRKMSRFHFIRVRVHKAEVQPGIVAARRYHATCRPMTILQVPVTVPHSERAPRALPMLCIPATACRRFEFISWGNLLLTYCFALQVGILKRCILRRNQDGAMLQVSVMVIRPLSFVMLFARSVLSA